MRLGWVGALALVVGVASSCNTTSPVSEYADRVEELVFEMNLELGALEDERHHGLRSITSEQAHFAARVVVREQFMAGLQSLDPPDRLDDVHIAALDIVGRLTAAEQAVAAEATNAESWAELDALWRGEYGQAFLEADDEAHELCLAAQAEFDDLSDDPFAASTPWVPPELRETVRVALSCDAIESS